MAKKKKLTATDNNAGAEEPKSPVTAAPNTVTNVPAATEAATTGQWGKVLLYSLIAVFVLMTVMSFWYGVSGDEKDMNAYGKFILDYFTSFGADKTALDPPDAFDKDGVVQFYGGFFDLIAAIVNKVSPLSEFTTRHILNAWAGFLAIFFAAKISIRVGGQRMAVICTWLMFLAPFFLGHAMNNPKDVPFAAAYIAAIYFFLRFYQKLPKVTWKDYIAPALSLAIAIDIRVAGILLIPYMVVYHFINVLFNKQDMRPTPAFFKSAVIIAITGYLGASLFWPYALQNPVSNPLNALAELSDFKISLRQMFEGQRVMSTDLPPSYLVKTFIITNAYVLLAGLVLAAIMFVMYRKSSTSSSRIIFIAFIFLFPLAYIIYKHSNVYHAWRHVLFIFPGAAIVAAYGWDTLIAHAKQPATRYAFSGLLVLGFLEPAVFTVATFPNTITYYNGFAGGVKNAYFNYEMDYYFNSMQPACEWFAKNELPKYKKTDTILVATNVPHITTEYFRKYPNIKVVYARYYERSNSKWDYAVWHRALIPEGILKNKSWTGNQIHMTSVEGLPLTVIVKRPSMYDYEGFEALKANNTDAAIPLLLQYSKVDAKNEMVNSMLARYYAGRNQMDSAASFINNTLAVNPDDAEATILKGQLLVAQGKAGEALALYDRLMEQYPDALELHYYKGIALQMSGQPNAAIQELNTAANSPQLRDAARKAIADIMAQQGPPQQAPNPLNPQ